MTSENTHRCAQLAEAPSALTVLEKEKPGGMAMNFRSTSFQ
jgi:hypothetical protein